MSKSNLYRCIREFQFTQPKRAATVYRLKSDYILYVSIHAAQAGCDLSRSDSSKYQYVSIHAAQAGCDKLEWIVLQSYISFNSRSPSGLRQGQMYHAKFLIVVSIHAAQAGCDQITAIQPRNPSCFNSRSPSGLRLTDNSVFSKREFQFTQPKRAATFAILSGRHWSRCFNSRSPSGLRRQSATACKPR